MPARDTRRMNDADLSLAVSGLPEAARDVLRRAARADQWERDELAERLLREPGGIELADLIDDLSINPEARRRMARVLGEVEARS